MSAWYPCAACTGMIYARHPNPVCEDCDKISRANRDEPDTEAPTTVHYDDEGWIVSDPSRTTPPPLPGYSFTRVYGTRRYRNEGNPAKTCSGGLPSLGKGY